MKNKSTILISSIMLVVVLVAVLVGVSAAWFGDVNLKNSRIDVNSALFGGSGTASGSAEFDISGSTVTIKSPSIKPAEVVPGWLTNNNGNPVPSGNTLLSGTMADGILTPAVPGIIYFPFKYDGVPLGDRFYEEYSRIGVTIYLTSASTFDPASSSTEVSRINYIEDFNVDFSLVSWDHTDAYGEDIYVPNPSASSINSSELNAGTTKPYYRATRYLNTDTGAYNYKIEMLIFPGVKYYLESKIYFATVDDETPAELLETTIFFNYTISEGVTFTLPGSGE